MLRFLYENKVGLCGLLEIKFKNRIAENVMNSMLRLWSVILNFNFYKGERILIVWLLLIFEVNVLEIGE